MNNLKINHLAVWLCIVLLHALGFLWYGVLFGEQWMAMVGMDEATAQANAPEISIWILNAVAIIAPVYLLAWLLSKLGVTDGLRGAVIGFLIAFCFTHLTIMNSNMFAGEPYALAWITGGYALACATLSGFILGAWTKKVS